MDRRAFIQKTGYAGVILLMDPIRSIAPQSDNLEENFINPPPSTAPYSYWFWMNGHVSKQGITLDLEAMKAVGIGGVLNFDAGTGIPKGPIEYGSDEWLALKKHAIEEAARLGMEFTMHNCPGFSASGGPWISPDLAMQQITWSETYVQGDKRVDYALPKPNSRLNFYKDIAVLAFPSLKEEELMQSVKITSAQTEIRFEFAEPFEARLITFYISAPGNENKNLPETGERTFVTLEASENGTQYSLVTQINTGVESELRAGDKYIVYDLPLTKAKYFRIVSTQPRRYRQVQFSGIKRLKNWLEKTNARPRNILRVEEASAIESEIEKDIPADSITDLNSIIDISAFVNDGNLQWDAPAGNWTILRIGYTPTGAMVQAAPDNGKGLECDKFNKAAMSFHFGKMMEKLMPVFKSLGGKGKFGLEIDSYEAGAQNWTPGFEKEFEKRCGYSLIKYLPVLTGGRIIGNAEIAERFAWDIRRVQADLMAENYYGHFSDLCKQHGFISYIEPYDSGPMEEMQAGAKADITMGEFWFGISTAFPVDNPVRRTPKLAASITNVNGRQVAAAEAFTAEPDASRWLEYPFALKAAGDRALAEGINRLIIHRFAHQPHPTAAPGMTMGPWGIHFDRTNTWWSQGKAWINYLHRCQTILQQGKFVADMLYFTGEDANMYTRAEAGQLEPFPFNGYEYDLINAHTILHDITIKDNRIFLRDGRSYALLSLQDFKAISFELLQKLRSLVQEGMILVGGKPGRSTGLTAYKDEDEQFKQLANEIWGKTDGNEVKEHSHGKGRVFWGMGLGEIFEKLDISRDFEYMTDSGNATILFTHRKTAVTDIYFISNQQRTYEKLACKFRVKDKVPELWDAATGAIQPIPVYEKCSDGICLPLQIEPYGSAIVVFRNKTPLPHLQSVVKNGETVLTAGYPQPEAPVIPATKANFTITLWVKPEMNILLRADLPADSKVELSTDYYAAYPFHYEVSPFGKHAACGFTIGRNGIAIWENGPAGTRITLAVPAAIEGWSHIAVRYQDNTPSVFLNGVMLKKGTRSESIVIAPMTYELRPLSWNEYNGDLLTPKLHRRTLSDSAIAELAKLRPRQGKSPFNIEFAGGDKPALLIKENGRYLFNYNDGNKKLHSITDLQKEILLTGPWQVKFPAGAGAPAKIVLPELISLHRHKESGVKYFSGTAIYSIRFSIPPNSIPGKQWLLDLGQVEVIAEITVNGKSLGIVWKRPYQIDITHTLRQGANDLEVKVTNLWTNRLIGDEQLPDPDKFAPFGGASGIPGITGGGIEQLPDWYLKGEPKPHNGRISFATWKHYDRKSPLAESGLIGPVRLIHAVTKPV